MQGRKKVVSALLNCSGSFYFPVRKALYNQIYSALADRWLERLIQQTLCPRRKLDNPAGRANPQLNHHGKTLLSENRWHEVRGEILRRTGLRCPLQMGLMSGRSPGDFPALF